MYFSVGNERKTSWMFAAGWLVSRGNGFCPGVDVAGDLMSWSFALCYGPGLTDRRNEPEATNVICTQRYGPLTCLFSFGKPCFLVHATEWKVRLRVVNVSFSLSLAIWKCLVLWNGALRLALFFYAIQRLAVVFTRVGHLCN